MEDIAVSGGVCSQHGAAAVDVRAVAGSAEVDACRLTRDEIGLRQVSSGRVFERLRDHMCGCDPEAIEAEAQFPAPAWGTV